jgi:hypothetical protein
MSTDAVIMSHPRLPFKGLKPFEERDWTIFFGRNAEISIIASNLKGSRLTVFYGPSGVGKSSVLRAGVGHEIEETIRFNCEEIGKPGYAFAYVNQWLGDPVAAVKYAVRQAVASVPNPDGDVSWMSRQFNPGPLVNQGDVEAEPAGLVDALAFWSKRLDVTILIVLDQFEEYFLYHPDEEAIGTFATEFPLAVNRRDLKVQFLISLRVDALARLDRFKDSMPDLFGNLLALPPLRRAGARDAIYRPIGAINANRSEADRVAIEPALVEEVLTQVRVGAVALATTGRGGIEREAAAPDAEDTPIETSYLQLVMDRLWDEEQRRGSRMLRATTFTELGGAEGIVRTHFAETIEKLNDAERAVVQDVLRYLVTPGGSKIAQEPGSLAGWTGHPPEEVEGVLTKLAAQEGRILRRVESPIPGHEPAFEIFHDVLARVVLSHVEALKVEERRLRAEAEKKETERRLKEQQEANQRQLEANRRLRHLAFALFSLLVMMVLAVILAAYQSIRAHQQAEIAKDATSKAEEQTRIAQAASKEARDAKAQALFEKEKAETQAEIARNEARRARIINAQRLAAHSSGLRSNFPQQSLLLAVEAIRSTRDREEPIAVAAEEALHEALGSIGGRPLSAPSSPVYRLIAAPDGRIITGHSDGTARVWDLKNPTALPLLLRGHEDTIYALAFAPDGRLATGSFDATARVWDLEHPTAQPLVLRGHEDTIYALAFAPDGRLITGSRDGTARVWDLEHPTAQPLVLRGHVAAIYALAFAPDGRLITGSRDGTARVWDLKNPTAQPLVLRGYKAAIYALAFAPDGRLAAGSRDEIARVWDLNPDRLMKLAQQVGGRNLSQKEWEQFFGQEPYRQTFPDLPHGEGVTRSGDRP